jgi:hypothetical protein
MTLWVLDPDSLSLLERGNPKIQERLCQVNTVNNLHPLLGGALA